MQLDFQIGSKPEQGVKNFFERGFFDRSSSCAAVHCRAYDINYFVQAARKVSYIRLCYDEPEIVYRKPNELFACFVVDELQRESFARRALGDNEREVCRDANRAVCPARLTVARNGHLNSVDRKVDFFYAEFDPFRRHYCLDFERPFLYEAENFRKVEVLVFVDGGDCIIRPAQLQLRQANCGNRAFEGRAMLVVYAEVELRITEL